MSIKYKKGLTLFDPFVKAGADVLPRLNAEASNKPCFNSKEEEKRNSGPFVFNFSIYTCQISCYLI